jgi:tetratricopeptide (TPR) repeat protein
VLVVCTERDEAADASATRLPVDSETVIHLEALDAAEIERVLGGLLGSGDVPAPLVERLARATDGNPLFVEQLVSSLIDGGDLVRADDGSWSLAEDVTRLPMPPSIGALLASRIDQLAVAARSVLQAGATIGLEFYRGAVQAMLPAELAADVDGSVGVLGQRRFVRLIGRTFADEPTFVFSHILVRDAAYDALLLRQRVDLHERFAAWLERVAGSRLLELEEIIGYHLEQGARSLAELGPLDERGAALAVAASDRLARSGARANLRGDLPAAANLFERAVALRRADDRSRVELQLDLAEVRVGLGEFDVADAVLAAAVAEATALADDLLATNAMLVGLFLHYSVDPHGRSHEVLREATAAIPTLEAAGDHDGLVRAWRLLGWVHGTACRYGEAERAVRNAVGHARLAGDRRAETRNAMSFTIAALHGPMPVPEAITLCDRVSADVAGDRRAEAVVLGASSQLLAMSGRFNEARSRYRLARELVEELGARWMDVSLDSGRAELLAGAPDRAERELRRDYDVLTRIGERYVLSTVAALLSEAVRSQGRGDEALVLAEVSESAAAEDDLEAQVLWRRARARILLDARRTEEALELGQRALERLEGTDAPVLRAGTLLDLARILAALGRVDEAAGAAGEALALFEAKADVVEARQAAALLAGLAERTSGGQ